MAITYSLRVNANGTKSVVATDVHTATDENVLVRSQILSEIAELKFGAQTIAARIAELEDILATQKPLFDQSEGV